jgi:CubicO group peptidase (beta-lactamase class C family)
MRPIGLLLCVSLGAASAADSIDATIQRAMTREGVPGLSLAVVRHGVIVRTGAYGYANLEWKTRVSDETKFEIASISKMFAGAAARILIEERRLDPEDPMSKYFADLPPSWTGMKVRHLITMSSGLPEDFASDLIPYDSDVTTPYDDASMLRAFFTLKMPAAVGERFVYSSPNYTMLGMIVSRIAGEPFPQFVQERIFGPAGMTDSSYIENAAIVPGRADGYRKTSTGELKKGWYLGQYLHSRPDDGVLTTARDLARWVVALQRRQIVKDPDKLWEAGAADSGRPLDYAYGWLIDTWLGHRRTSHAGGFRTGFHTFIARYPDDDLALVVLTNCDFSAIRNYVNLLTRNYLTTVPDPEVERTRPDPDPDQTRRLVAALEGVRHGTIDESLMYVDAVEPAGLSEVSGFLQAAGPFTYAGRARLPGEGLTMHGRRLVDYETLRTQVKGEMSYITAYRDAAGKVAYLEETN